MAFNSSDTRQRAYNRIDTSNPHGSWIDEKFYNRAGTVGSKTLIGNWQEEERLEADMNAAGRDQTIVRKDGKYYKGGFESTAYLLSDKEESERLAQTVTMHRESFTEKNGDISTTKKPQLGVRSNIRAQMILEQAQAELKAQEEAQRQRDAPLTSTYRETISHNSNASATKGVFAGRTEGAPSYTEDVPITLYTGNPHTGSTMTVHGKTMADGTGNPLAKNTNFTYNKFAL